MRKILSITLVAAIIFSVFSFQGCSKKGENVIKIGAILPLTGSLSSLGEKENRMLIFSEKIINDKKIIKAKIELDIQDAQFKPALSATIAHKFVGLNIKYVISSTTPLSAAAIPIFEQNGVVTFVHSMTNSLLINTRLALRIYPSIYDEIACISKWLKGTKKKNIKIFVLRLKSEWSALWVDKFKENNQEIKIMGDEYVLNNLDVKNVLSKAKIFNPDYILLLGYGNEYPSLLKQIIESKLNAKIIGNIGFAYSGTIESAKSMNNLNILKGSYFPFMKINMNSAYFKTLNELYESQYQTSILDEPGALYLYDTLMLLVKSIKAVGNKPTKIRNYLVNDIKTYTGITGNINFLENGDVQIPLVMAKYTEGGKIEIIGE